MPHFSCKCDDLLAFLFVFKEVGYLYRAVGGYLQGVFESLGARMEERQEDSPRIGLDHTLRGKTRKEAARLFFETLVCL